MCHSWVILRPLKGRGGLFESSLWLLACDVFRISRLMSHNKAGSMFSVQLTLSGQVSYVNSLDLNVNNEDFISNTHIHR